MSLTYDQIGLNYANLRKPDLRIAALIQRALGSAETVLSVGAGAGSYEPTDRQVTALEPSAEMIRQRPAAAAPAIRGVAEDLPFADNSFDAAMAVLTVHHWSDKAKGLAEMRRVARGPVAVVTFDPAHRGCWLTDYVPQLATLDEAQMPCMADYGAWLGAVNVEMVPIPHDCSDGFLYAYWRRPHAYLDPKIRAAMSSFWKIDGFAAGMDRLADDLASCAWEARYGELLKLDAIDAGYRLVSSV
jgi:SAM-dependent methyltransferase